MSEPITSAFLRIFPASLLCALAACGGDSSNGGGATGAACDTNGDCPEEQACVAQGDRSQCRPICTGSGDECGVEASCGGVGVLDVDVCQEREDEDSPPDAQEQPRIPCASDAECAELGANAICAEWNGQRDCTLPCSTESDCDLPMFDVLTCMQDQGDQDRMACLPDERCITNPLDCVESGVGPDGGTGGFGTDAGFDNPFPDGGSDF